MNQLFFTVDYSSRPVDMEIGNDSICDFYYAYLTVKRPFICGIFYFVSGIPHNFPKLCIAIALVIKNLEQVSLQTASYVLPRFTV